MNYYIADTHFGHHNIINMANRPFQCVQDMEDALIEKWNRKVKDNDEIYIIGDLFYQHDHIDSILSRLNGKKHLITGNHESKWLTHQYRPYFQSIQSSLEIVDQNHTIYMCHYPMVCYPKQSRAYMIHGHIHNDTLFDYWCVLLKRARILNAGVDINHFEPVTLNELIENNTLYKSQVKESYPMHLLSVRYHLNALNEHHLTKEDVYQTLTDKLNQHNITCYREGLYHCDETHLDLIQALQNQILNDDIALKLIKNFDIVYVDHQGNYSYLNYLHQEHIYLK